MDNPLPGSPFKYHFLKIIIQILNKIILINSPYLFQNENLFFLFETNQAGSESLNNIEIGCNVHKRKALTI